MDFYRIKEQMTKNGTIEIYPDFKVGRSKDLMVRGKSFYAIWDEENKIWSTDEYDVQRFVDLELIEYKDMLAKKTESAIRIKYMSDFSSKSWSSYRSFLQHLSDNSHQLDEKLTFLNDEITKKDYVSRKLQYPLESGSIEAYDELLSTLYDPEERLKLEWAIGAIVAGDAKDIQKFIVLYGEAGTGKSTVLNIIQKLFKGYYTTFEAKALTSASNSFSTEVFKYNPLVAIQHDGDLSKIEDNTKLNSIISHEEMTMNEKYKPSYMARINCFLFMGTNRPVKITDAKSGIIRRLIDVRPTGNKVSSKKYQSLMQQIDFELGAIAYHCLNTYRALGKNYYASYRPLDMILQTDVFFNFVEYNYHVFKEQDGVSLSQGYDMYKTYCNEASIEYVYPRHKFREELKNYFKKFDDVTRVDGKQIRSYYSVFLDTKFKSSDLVKEDSPISLVLDKKSSLFDELAEDYPAQYANDNETPSKKWDSVTTTLKDLDTTKLHYVKLPLNHIVIDFDLKDESGNKSIEKNLEEANKWPPTYTEFSKSGHGVHLHYIYDGDVEALSRIFDNGIEIKVFTGNTSLRRKLTECNNIPIATINSGLPLKGVKMINTNTFKNENSIRNLIKKNINKEIHPGTKPSIDFIYTILEEAYTDGIVYDVTDMRNDVLVFATNSTNQSLYCLNLVNKMKFKSEKELDNVDNYNSDELVFYDVEVYPNLFLIVWKFKGPNKNKVYMYNPTAEEVGELFNLKLIGFNCRRYDNHILYARYIGYNNEQLFQLSQKIVNNNKSVLFREAYNISYTDVYDFSSIKQSLKKFQIELGIHHLELGFKWDEPVPEDKWPLVAEYCGNDVDATEATFNDRIEDFNARLILSELSGLTPNDTTQQHTSRIIFGTDQNPQDNFIYTNLSEKFPGYVFDGGKSIYRGEETGEGGYVYAEPGMYENVALLDVASMHPNSLINMNMFGRYTPKFKELLDARISIKHKDFKTAKKMLGGILEKYLNEEQAPALAYALKIVINIVYGLTSASFDNKFKDPRNVDNIVAKRGALFMIELKHAVQEKGFTVAHIKTDSIKIPNATKEIIEFVMDFGKKYGYTFEHEDTYSKFCLVNDAVYIAKTKNGEWTATGAQFAQPYVFKTLFSKEPIDFHDMCEVKSVSTALYLDVNENLGPDEHDYHFIGKIGEFCPVNDGYNGGILLREGNDKYSAPSGTKGYRWLESEVVKTMEYNKVINKNYYNVLVDEAVSTISKYGDFEQFIY